MTTYADKTALITGASSGIGATFARTLAAQGTHLILVARSEDKLRDLATTLATQHDIRADVLTADLSRPEAGQKLFAATQQLGLSIDILINNAGFATYGPFDSLDADSIFAHLLAATPPGGPRGRRHPRPHGTAARSSAGGADNGAVGGPGGPPQW
jgi:short-subunit dehydrogenase